MLTWLTEGNFTSIQLHLLCWYCKISYISEYYTTTSHSTGSTLAQDQNNPASVDFL